MKSSRRKQKSKLKAEKKPDTASLAAKLRVDEAAGHIKNGMFSKAMFLYNQVVIILSQILNNCC